MTDFADTYEEIAYDDPMRLRELLLERDAEIDRLKHQIATEHARKAREVERLSGSPAPCVCSICAEVYDE